MEIIAATQRHFGRERLLDEGADLSAEGHVVIIERGVDKSSCRYIIECLLSPLYLRTENALDMAGVP